MLACTDEEFHKMVKDLIGKRRKFESAVTEDISTPQA